MTSHRHPHHLGRLLMAAGAMCLATAPAFAQGSPTSTDGRPGAHVHGHHGKYAQRHMGMRGHHGHHGFARHDHLRGLKLTDEQRDKIFDIRHAAAPEMRQIGKDIAEARQALRALMHADTYDEAQVQAAAERQGAAIAKAAVLRASTTHQIHAVLTAEQRQQLQERRDRKKDRGARKDS